jgi:hypothetical protein
MKCPKCGTDNLLTAVFCRGCHEKLDLNAMKPDALLHEAKKTAALGKTPLWLRITSAVIGGILVLILIGLVCPVSQLHVSPEGTPETGKKFKELRKGTGEVVLTNEEVTSILKAETEIEHSPAQGNMKFSNLSAYLLPGNRVKLVMQAKAYDFLPLSYVAKVTLAADGTLQFGADGARIGYVPMMFGLDDWVYEAFRRMLGGKRHLETIRGRIKEVSTSEGSVTFKY